MAKLGKNSYRTAKGEKKLNCYMVPLTKELVAQTNITESDELKITTKDNKIIIEKENK